MKMYGIETVTYPIQLTPKCLMIKSWLLFVLKRKDSSSKKDGFHTTQDIKKKKSDVFLNV